MIVKTITTKACCGASAIYFIVDAPLSLDTIKKFTDNGFKEQPKFAQQGILYVFNDDFSLSGQLGNTKLQLTCKTKDCQNDLRILDSIL